MNERQEQILLSLDRFSFMSRRHLQRLHRLGGDRNAQKVLKQMDEYLHSFRDGDTVYYLNKYGREMIGSTRRIKRTLQTKHTLMRNDFYFYIGCPVYWKNEMKVVIDGKVILIADAIFKKDGRYHFLEVDNTQTMAENKIKIGKYKDLLNKGLQQQFGYFPTLHIVTANRMRVKRFKEMCEGLPVNVYWIDDIK